MKQSIYAAAGSFAMRQEAVKGVHILRYEPEKGDFVAAGDYRGEINLGQRAWDPEKRLLYLTHEWKEAPGGEPGGRVYTVRPNPENGSLEWLSEASTAGAVPSYICLEQSGKYMLVPHHTTRNTVVKTVKQADGTFQAKTEWDDCSLVLLERKPDGTVGAAVDAYVEPQGSGSHFHNCVQSPDGKLILVCDKGADKLHRFRLDAEKGKLIYLGNTFVEAGSHPRYGLFHPTAGLFYQNCENSAFLYVWAWDGGTGELVRKARLPLLTDEKEAASWTKEGASDLVMTADAKYLYAAVRGLNRLAVFGLGADGMPTLLQNLSCMGQNPRGLCLSPDERFLFVMNRDSDTVTRFWRGEDGCLREDGVAAKFPLPANLIFLTRKLIGTK